MFCPDRSHRQRKKVTQVSDEEAVRNPFEGGSGGPYVKFENPGDEVSGTITKIEIRQEVVNGEVKK